MHMSDNQDRLCLYKMVYGKNVMCTNGLFHIIDKEHNEIYINKDTGELDRRGKYRTEAVLNNAIIAEVINDKKIKYVLLDKQTLKCMYKTTGKIIYVDKNIMFDTNGLVLSCNGKKLTTVDNIRSVVNMTGRYYLINSRNMYEDKVVMYVEHGDFVNDLTKDKKYAINKHMDDKSIVDILCMYGGRYQYNFSKHECINLFTMEREEDIQLWTLN